MDIAVIVPIYDFDLIDKKHEIKEWEMLKKPKKVKVGDKIYFIQKKKVRACSEIEDIEYIYDDVTAASRKTVPITKIIFKLKNQKVFNGKTDIKSFQIFRYRWWTDEDLI